MQINIPEPARMKEECHKPYKRVQIPNSEVSCYVLFASVCVLFLVQLGSFSYDGIEDLQNLPELMLLLIEMTLLHLRLDPAVTMQANSQLSDQEFCPCLDCTIGLLVFILNN